MSDFVRATYDGKPCWLNMDYVIDMFPESYHYKAYTMDFDRSAYLISLDEYFKWRKRNEEQE